MRRWHLPIQWRGLRTQVLLWTVLPLTVLLLMFAFSGVSSHQNSMRDLAVDENSRLIRALAMLVAVQRENYAWEAQITEDAVPLDVLELDTILAIEHPHAVGTVLLVDQEGQILYSRGAVPDADELQTWLTIAHGMVGDSRVFFTSIKPESDVIAYADVPDTDWALIIQESWHSLTDPLVQIERLLPLVLFTASIISLFTLVFGLRYVVRPLQELGHRADLLGQGRFDAVAEPIGGVREIEDLRLTMHQMAEQLQSYQLALQDYLRALTQAQEAERARLGRELHDETVQTLIALGHKAQMVQRNFERNSDQTGRYIQEMRDVVAQAIDEVRRFSRALHPHYLDELGLPTVLMMLAREANAQFGVIGTARVLPSEIELTFYRIAQEAFNNARHHADASQILAELRFEQEQVVLIVRDNGKGFTIPTRLSELTHQGHFGLVGMRERAQLVGADLQILSDIGKGTTITLTLKLGIDVS